MYEGTGLNGTLASGIESELARPAEISRPSQLPGSLSAGIEDDLLRRRTISEPPGGGRTSFYRLLHRSDAEAAQTLGERLYIHGFSVVETDEGEKSQIVGTHPKVPSENSFGEVVIRSTNSSVLLDK